MKRPLAAEDPNGDGDGSRSSSLLAGFVVRLTRVCLLLYPHSFRVDVGRALTKDVERLANEMTKSHGLLRSVGWCARHSISMFANAALEWRDEIERRRGVRSQENSGSMTSKQSRAGLQIRALQAASVLDVKLGVRMLLKYPGLSVVSVAGMAVAIAIGAGGFGLIGAFLDAELPFEEGERLVIVQNSDIRSPGNPDERSLHEFLMWRDALGSVSDLSAFSLQRTTVSVDGGVTAEVSVARMTASGFRATRVPSARGRTLQDEDERSGAAPVVVIGHAEWRRLFEGDPDVIGRRVRLGSTVHTIVGIMPEGYRFPVNQGFWTPLQLNPADHQVGAGPAIKVFGRIAPEATLREAQSELSALSGQAGALYPTSREHIRARVLPYATAMLGIDGPARARMIRPFQIAFALMLIVVAVNVAILVYARTSARRGEIAVRNALGASRGRVVSQLFAEAMALSVTAAALGLGLAALGFNWFRVLLLQMNPESFPFWVDLSVSPGLVVYVAGLAILAAFIVGVLPAMKATGSGTRSAIQELHSTGSSLPLGRGWTCLIIVQVALTVALLPYALLVAVPFATRGNADPDYAVDRFVVAALSQETQPGIDDAPGAELSTFSRGVEELLTQLEREPGIESVTFASRVPGEEGVTRLEIEGSGESPSVWLNQVHTGLFDAFDVSILYGVGFMPSDARTQPHVAVVDRAFVEEVMGGGEVLGRRIRFRDAGETQQDGRDADGRWLQIVGVVSVFTVPPPLQRVAPKVYVPLALANAPPTIRVAIRARPDTPPAALLVRVREIAAAVDPGLLFRELTTASAAERTRKQLLLFGAILVGAITSSTLLLAAAGISAMMSFVVVSRRREIGIRSALGAAPGRLLVAIFKRAAIQLGAGVGVGLAAAETVARLAGGSLVVGESAYLAPMVACLMALVGLVATLGPALQGLAVQPTEALQGD